MRIPEVIAECNETVCGTYQNFSCRATENASYIGKTILRPWQAKVPVVEEPPLDFDNPEEESVAPIIEPEQPLAPVEPEKKPEQVEMQEQSEETFDPLATQHQQPQPEPDEEVEIEVIKHSIENETPLVDENPPVVEDFEKALFINLKILLFDISYIQSK